MEVEYTRHFIGKDSLDIRVMAAMQEVPRHEFLPEDLRDFAYHNGPQPIGSGQTISQPYIVALMSDLLNTKSSDIILEIGTGSGYQAAILSKLVTQVYSVEIIKKLASKALNLLKELGYDNVVVRNDNGYFGWAEHAPYDGIIVTAAAPHVPQPLIDQCSRWGIRPYCHSDMRPRSCARRAVSRSRRARSSSSLMCAAPCTVAFSAFHTFLEIRVFLLERLERLFQGGEALARGLIGLLLERFSRLIFSWMMRRSSLSSASGFSRFPCESASPPRRVDFDGLVRQLPRSAI